MARTKSTNTADTAPKNVAPKKIDRDYYVPVKSNVKGELIYEAKDGSYTERWSDFGEVVEIPYSELVHIKNAKRAFFVNNWIVLEDTDEYTAQDFYRALNIDKLYPNSDKVKDMNDVFALDTKEMGSFISSVSEGYKENIATFAGQLIKENDPRLDKKSKVKALEKALDRKLVNED